ncbi:hypothetical protein [Chitinophaga caseinilytica]|uniref:DUF3592 domain-containing protein n=1 Tax=Chitinophaga caseinilytica TaxID=2267521 RepID=A0ABZ2Z3H5_9BACT
MNKYIIYIVLLVLLVVIGIQALIKTRDREVVRNQSIIGEAIITDVSIASSYRRALTYQYVFDGRQYKGEKLVNSSGGFLSSIVGKSFPLVINGDNPEKSELLIFRKDFSDFDLDFPDSLKWVEE